MYIYHANHAFTSYLITIEHTIHIHTFINGVIRSCSELLHTYNHKFNYTLHHMTTHYTVWYNNTVLLTVSTFCWLCSVTTPRIVLL